MLTCPCRKAYIGQTKRELKYNQSVFDISLWYGHHIRLLHLLHVQCNCNVFSALWRWADMSGSILWLLPESQARKEWSDLSHYSSVKGTLEDKTWLQHALKKARNLSWGVSAQLFSKVYRFFSPSNSIALPDCQYKMCLNYQDPKRHMYAQLHYSSGSSLRLQQQKSFNHPHSQLQRGHMVATLQSNYLLEGSQIVAIVLRMCLYPLALYEGLLGAFGDTHCNPDDSYSLCLCSQISGNQNKSPFPQWNECWMLTLNLVHLSSA